MGSKNVFSEQEVAEILRNAIAIEEQGLVDHAYKPGVTLEELQRVADEIGVSPKALEMALGLTGTPTERKRRFMTFKETFERVVQGELDPDDFDIVTAKLKLSQASQNMGVTQVGRTFSANTSTGAGGARVQVASRHGRTKIEVTSSPVAGIMGALYPATLFGLMAGIGIGQTNPLAGFLTGIVTIGTGLWGCRALLETNNERSKKLADELQKAVEEHLEVQKPAVTPEQLAEASRSTEESAVQRIELP